MDTTTGAKRAIHSLTLKSLAVVAVAFVASRFDVPLPPGGAEEIVTAGIDLMATLGLLGAAIGRVRARGPIS